MSSSNSKDSTLPSRNTYKNRGEQPQNNSEIVRASPPPDDDDNNGQADMHAEQPGNLDGFGRCMRNGRRKAFYEKRLNARNVTREGLGPRPWPLYLPPLVDIFRLKILLRPSFRFFP